MIPDSATRRLTPAHWRFLKFLAVGGFAAAVNFGSRILFNVWLSYPLAILLAYLLGMLTAFCLNRALVFRASTSPLHRQVMWFSVINLLALAQTLAISLLLARWIFPGVGWTWQPELCAHAIGVSVPVVTSYIGHRHLSFR